MPNKESKCECSLCGEMLAKSNYYKSYSKFYRSGHLPICKDCFGREFARYAAEYHSNKMAMQRMCMAFDIYFEESMFDNCDNDDSTVVGNYFRKLNMVQCKGKTLDTSIESGFHFSGERKASDGFLSRDEESREKDLEHEKEEIDNSDIEKWGFGFDAIDYAILNSHEKLLKNSNPDSDSNASIFINDLCYIKMQQMKAVREGHVDDYNKLTEQYRKTFTQAGLKTVKDASVADWFDIGVNIETIEKYTPAEYYKNKKLFKDFDGIGDYFSRFLVRPLRNLMHGTKDRDEEFSVRNEEEMDGFADDE